jgi:hypothetical protein
MLYLSLYAPNWAQGVLCIKRYIESWAWWHTPEIPALEKVSQENHKFKASLGYITCDSLCYIAETVYKQQQQQHTHTHTHKDLLNKYGVIRNTICFYAYFLVGAKIFS